MVMVDGKPAATLALLWSDPAFWGQRPPDAVYLHELAVRRATPAAGSCDRRVEWANAQAVAAGREYLRLDCMSDNDVLRGYYEGLGFESRGEAVFDDFTATLFERRCRA